MGAKAKVWVVDDDPIMQTLYDECLQDDFQVLCVSSGQECLDALQREVPAAVLMDVEMPGLDGYQTCRALNEALAGEAPPVLFVSARDQLEDRMKGYEAGGSDYVCKPWNRPELVAKIGRMLAAQVERRSLARERDEAVEAVLGSADMVGELGVVLDFQREVGGCADYPSLAVKLLQTLARFGWDGCVRVAGAADTICFNQDGRCSALEWSILESLAAQTEGPRIRPLQRNTSFNFGSVILFVRGLLMRRDGDVDEATAERMGRAIDNIALVLESAVARVAAIDSQGMAHDLNHLREVVSLAKGTLHDVVLRNRATTEAVERGYEDLKAGLEDSFMHLGLTAVQEEHLADLVRGQSAHALEVLAEGRRTEGDLQRIVEALSAELTRSA